MFTNDSVGRLGKGLDHIVTLVFETKATIEDIQLNDVAQVMRRRGLRHRIASQGEARRGQWI